MAGLSDADQSGFSLPRLDPGGAHCVGSSFVPGSRQARRDARDSGMAELLLQVAHVRAGALPGARPVHPVDEIKEYAAMDDGGGFNHAPGTGILRLSFPAGFRSTPFTACGKSAMSVIPNEVRNLSGFESKEREGFLGTQRASVHRERSP